MFLFLEIFDYLISTLAGVRDEIHLTDAICNLIQDRPVIAYQYLVKLCDTEIS
jgi:UTP-glucose-1-phosphate uridylyltransferase